MQTSYQDKLRHLIETSPILKPDEKTEWLDMLTLMNDKQASELEAILKAGISLAAKPQPSPSTAPPPPAKVVPPPLGSLPQDLPIAPTHIPKLSHISNLPTELVEPAPRLMPAPAGAKPLPKASPAAPIPPSIPTPPIPAPTPRPVPPSPKNADAIAQVRTPSDTPIIKVEALPDVAKLNLATLRTLKHDEVLIRLQQLVKLEGYFNVLSYLEESPLYKTYIATGKKILASPESPFDELAKQDRSIMAKTEFESFADILQKIQVN